MRSRIQTVKNFILQHSAQYTDQAPAEREINWLVARVLDFEALVSGWKLQDISSIMNEYYAVVADTMLRSGGDINCFCGPTIVIHFGALQAVKEATVIQAAKDALHNLRKSVEGLPVGLGLCRGTVVYGRFGSRARATFTAFGPPQICAEQLATRGPGLRICERVAGNISGIAGETLPEICAHWCVATCGRSSE